MSDVVRFVDELPEPQNAKTGPQLAPWLLALRDNPGRWGEIARYPWTRAQTARSRAAKARQAHPELETAVRHVGDEALLFMRVKS